MMPLMPSWTSWALIFGVFRYSGRSPPLFIDRVVGFVLKLRGCMYFYICCLSNVQIDPVTGQQTSADGNWAVVTLQTNYGAKVVFSSVSGDNHENPTFFKTESL
jgi:hypothetical protein